MSEPQHPTPFGVQKASQNDVPGSTANPAPGAAVINLDSVAAVGARLTQLREAKNWSLDDVSARLKVSPQKLRALESGDLSLFPDRTFAAGIVRSYAKIMGADPAPFTAALRQANGPVEQNLSLPASSGAGLPRGRVSVPLGSSPKRRSWLWGIAAIIVAVVALAMWHTGGDSAVWLARLKASANGTPVAAGTDTTAASSVATPDEIAASGGTPGDVTAGASAPVVAQANPNAAPMPTPLGTDSAPASAMTVSPGKAVQATPGSPPAVAATTATPGAGTDSVGTGENAIELKVTKDSWFSVRQKDGKEVYSGLVHAGSTQRVSGDAPFKVTMGNRAGVDSLTFDGQPVDEAKFGSSKGNVARFTLP